MGRIYGPYLWVVFVGVVWINVQATEYIVPSIHASAVGDILASPCLHHPPFGVVWRFEVPPIVDYTKIDGVFIRYHCPLFDTIIWDKTAQRAYWVNPAVFVDGFLRDLRHNNEFRWHTFTTPAYHLYRMIKERNDLRRTYFTERASRFGCVPYDFSRTRDCTYPPRNPVPKRSSPKSNLEAPVAPAPNSTSSP
ncbi:envelope glycoprotein L [Macropodid alphaherpesvirus 1]|uniref:Envelope glycoprotein L n=1 Tax=Macropodid alphaherpesvirus 1 TaxID=137443 RepID=A0A0Y0ABU6_9ALPH|nr:envelope glycoprotein L [Macropodid alphaherpesvirus 1]AMB17055.1 envelope glycoprotein L [Macropodid alphaherpesvirus 1]